MSQRSWPLAALLAALAGCSSNPSTSTDGGAAAEAGMPPVEAGTSSAGHALSTLAVVGQSVYAMTTDATNAYVVEGTDTGTIVQIPLAGGAPTTLATGILYAPAIAVTGGSVYWVLAYSSNNEPPDASPDGVLMSAPVGGGASAVVVGGLAYPDTLAVDSSGAYWTTSGQCFGAAPCTANLMTVPLSGGTPVLLAAITGSPQAIAVDGTNVYWGTGDGRLMQVPKAGGAATKLAFYETSVRALAVDATSVYWATSGGDLMKTPIGGGASTALVVGLDQISSVAVDGGAVYFTTASYPTSHVLKVAAGGGAPETLWSGNDTPETVRVDATSVYFATSAGALMKITPK